MKHLVGTVLAIALSATAASAAHIEFSGSFCLTAANTTCTTNNWNVGQCFATRFVAPNIGDTASTKLSIFSRTYATDFTLASGSLIGTTFQPVTVTKIASGGFQYNAAMRLTSQSPASPTSTTPFITQTGNVDGWDNIAGCTVQFKAAHTRCPQTFC